MNIGRLNRLVVIEQPSSSQDDIGQPAGDLSIREPRSTRIKADQEASEFCEER